MICGGFPNFALISLPDRALYLYVDSTGASKSHTMHILGSLMGGVTLVFIPLLTLSADVLEKFKPRILRSTRSTFHTSTSVGQNMKI